MARSTTFHGYKTRFGFGDATAFDAPNPTSLAGCTNLGELKSVTRSGQTGATISARHLESPAGYDEMIPGFGTGGTYELTFNYHPVLERLLDTLAPDPGANPVTGGTAVKDPPRYGRRLAYLSDRFGNFEYARVIFDPPARTVAEDGTQTMTVTVTVVEGKPVRIAAAGPAADPGTYTAPTG